jgi:murein DD-endopeptidase MepM/ murein hydrolase activator NlpD
MTTSAPDPERLSTGWSPRARRERRRIPLKLFAFVLLVPVLTGLFAAPAAPRVAADQLSDAKAAKNALEKKIAAQKAQISDLNALQSGLRTQISQTRVELQGISVDLGKKRRQIAAMRAVIVRVQAKYNELVKQLLQLDGSIDRIVAQESETRSDLATRKALLAQRIRSAYETDRTSLLETFLTGGSFTDILTEVSYYLDVGAQDKQLAQQISSDKETLASLHDTVVEARAETDDLRIKTAAQRVQLDASLKALRAAEAQLHALEVATARALAAQRKAYALAQKNKKALARALRAAAAAQHRLQKKIDKIIASQVSRGNIPSAYNGTLRWPMGGQVTQNFGCTGVPFEPPLGSCAHFHQGIDMVAAYGTAIHASAGGTVVYCGWNYADGADPAWIVIVAHSRSLQTWYAHMVPSCPVHAGHHVSAGQVVGHEGNTGHSTGAHLHWAVRKGGTFVNPRFFL